MVLMTDDLITPDVYRWAIAKAASLRDHRLNSSDKTVWWATTHRMLTTHAPAEETCGECGEAWPCGTVEAAVADLRSGTLGY